MRRDPYATSAPEPRVQPVAAAELERLTDRLQGLVGPGSSIDRAEISTWVAETSAQFATAPITIFVPILVERIVRDKIISGTRPTP